MNDASISPGMGHNAPPFDMQVLPDHLAMENTDLQTRYKELKEAAERGAKMDIPDEETAGKVADYVRQIGEFLKTAEDRRKKTKDPFIEGGRVVDGFFNAMIDDLAGSKKDILARINAFQNRLAEARRIAAEREAQQKREEEEFLKRQAEEAAAKARTESDESKVIALEAKSVEKRVEAERAEKVAAAPTSAVSRVRSTYGSVATVRRTLKFKVTDLNIVPRHLLILNDAAVKAHMKTAPKDGLPQTVEGIEFYYEESTVVR